MGAKAIIPSGDEEAMKAAAGEGSYAVVLLPLCCITRHTASWSVGLQACYNIASLIDIHGALAVNHSTAYAVLFPTTQVP